MKIYTTLIFLLCISFMTAQNAILTGKITEKSTGEPLISATIKIEKQGTISDFDGSYRFELPAGDYTITYSYVGYKTEQQVITLTSGETTVIDIALVLSENLLEAATVTSGKFEKPLGEVTVSLDIIKPSFIKNSGESSIDGVLDKLPGVAIIDGQPNIRGGAGYSYGAGSRVLLLIDDIPFLSPDAGAPSWNEVPFENIGQVEVVKGAASTLYGSSALNGIINVRTAYAKSKPIREFSIFHTRYLSPEDKDKQWWTTAPTATGASFSLREKIKKLDVVWGNYIFDEKSFNQNTSTQYFRLSSGIRYRMTDRFNIGFNAVVNDGRNHSFFFWKDNKKGAYKGAPGTISTNNKQRLYIDPFINYFGKTGFNHKLLGRFFSVSNETGEGRSNKSKLYYGEYRLQKKFENWQLIATTGLVASKTTVDAELYGDTSYVSGNKAFYAQLNKKFGQRLNLSAGFRYESNFIDSPETIVIGDTIKAGKLTDSRKIFRVGANFKAADFTFLRASWGQGYRYPTIAEKYISTIIGGGLAISPNPHLEAETGWSTEIGIKQGLKIGNFNGFIDLSAFWSEYQNMMEFTFVDFFTGFQSQNVGSTVIKGGEISFSGHGKIGGIPMSLLTGYTYINPKFAAFDTTYVVAGEKPTEGQQNALNSSVNYNILKYRSKHLAKLDWEATFNNFSFGIASVYTSKMEAVDNIFEALIVKGLTDFRKEHEKGAFINNFRLSYRFSKITKATIFLNNAFNEEYSVRPGLLEAPRNLRFRMDFVF